MKLVADAVIPAAGVGKRMGSKIPKQYLKLGDLTVLERSCRIFLENPRIRRVIIAVNPDDPIFRTLDIANHPKVIRALGGKERADSVLNGLANVSADFVLVHDAARPLLCEEDLEALLDAGFKSADGAILASKMADTVKKSSKNTEMAGMIFPSISRTVPRECLYRALTPQMFSTDLLIKSLTVAMNKGVNVTDEASAVESCGGHPLLVECKKPNFKLTLPQDLILAQALLQFEGKL